MSLYSLLTLFFFFFETVKPNASSKAKPDTHFWISSVERATSAGAVTPAVEFYISSENSSGAGPSLARRNGHSLSCVTDSDCNTTALMARWGQMWCDRLKRNKKNGRRRTDTGIAGPCPTCTVCCRQGEGEWTVPKMESMAGENFGPSKIN